MSSTKKPRIARATAAEQNLFWKLRALEKDASFVELLKANGHWPIEHELSKRGMPASRLQHAMASFALNSGLDAKRYTLFTQACERLGEGAVRDDVETAIKKERALRLKRKGPIAK